MKGSVQSSRGKWWVVFYEGRDPTTGRKSYKWVSGWDTKADAEQERIRINYEMGLGSYVQPTKLTVADFLQRWLCDYARQSVAPKTFERYEEIIRSRLVPALGAHRLSDLSALQIQGAQTRWLASGRAAQTVVHYRRVLNVALAHAVKWGLLPRNPSAGVSLPRPEKREIRVPSAEELQRLLAAAEAAGFWLPVVLAVGTGLRMGEILGLRWEDIDLDRGLLVVRQSLEQTRNGLRFKSPKTHRSRRPVYLPPFVSEVLGAQRAERGLLFANAGGEPRWSVQSASRVFAQVADQAGVPDTRFHDLRHYHASTLLRQGANVKLIQERLGHARVQTTMDIYTHTAEDDHRELAERMENFLSERSSGH